ncbi:hypothetical protein [Streptosporangium sp. KLBMP 9127]|nr:hypothetical protein [Streptosporangium sp. KLBMP 9127]
MLAVGAMASVMLAAAPASAAESPAPIPAYKTPAVWAAETPALWKTAAHDYRTDSGISPEAAIEKASAASRIKPFIEFVKKNWPRISKAAKASGKWAWYKANICAGGASWSIYRWSKGDTILLVTNKTEAAIRAVHGCIKAL